MLYSLFFCARLSIEGTSLTAKRVPDSLMGHLTPSSPPTPGSNLSYLQEEVFEEDGKVEEYIAFDVSEM